MVDRHCLMLGASPILVDQHEAWAIDQISRSEALSDPLHEMRLAGAEITQQEHQVTPQQQLAQTLADANRLCGAMGDKIEHMLRLDGVRKLLAHAPHCSTK